LGRCSILFFFLAATCILGSDGLCSAFFFRSGSSSSFHKKGDLVPNCVRSCINEKSSKFGKKGLGFCSCLCLRSYWFGLAHNVRPRGCSLLHAPCTWDKAADRHAFTTAVRRAPTSVGELRTRQGGVDALWIGPTDIVPMCLMDACFNGG
jgi:hypothetical protein